MTEKRQEDETPGAVAEQALGGRLSGPGNLWGDTVTPPQSLICETPVQNQAPEPEVSEADLGALSVDTLAVTCPVDQTVITRLADLTGRRVFIGPGNVFEGDSVRIGSIPGTYDPNIWIQPFKDSETGPTRIKVEGSAHRHILGHNIRGGPLSIVACGRYLVRIASDYLGLDLPDWTTWKLTRVDLTEVYDCGSEDGSLEAYRGLADGLRRSTALKGEPRQMGTCIYAGSGFKAYLKAPEVRKHKPLWASPSDLVQLMHDAANLVRLETTYRQDRITRLTEASLGSLDEVPLKEAARRRIARYTRLGSEGMETVRTIEAVTNRLGAMYPPQTAVALMGTWYRLTTLGEEGTRRHLTRATYYRHLKQLRDAGCSWQGTDVMRIELKSALPPGFCFSPRSPWAVRGEDPRVTAVLGAA